VLLTLISNHHVCFALLTVLPHLHASDEAAMLKCKLLLVCNGKCWLRYRISYWTVMHWCWEGSFLP